MSLKMTHKKRADLLITLVLTICGARTAAAIDFSVKERSGPVSWYNLSKASFETVETGQVLSYGTLIHVGEAGKVKFEATKDSSYAENDIKILELKTPGVMRLPSRLRNIETDEYMLKDLPTGGGEVVTEKPSLDFRQAWQRLTAVLTLPSEKKKMPKVARESSDLDINTAGYLGKIKWQYPLGDLTIHSRAYPRSLEIYWKAETIHGGIYRVFFWPTNKSRAPALDRILSDRYNLSIPEEGSYYLQVTSLDGKYRSQKRLVHAAAPGRNGNGETPGKSTELVNLKTQAGEMLPPDNFVIFGSAQSTQITFSWRFPDIPGNILPIEYQFQLQNKKTGKDLFNHRTKATSITMPLGEHGDYEWQVTAHNGPGYQKSTFQTLTFLETAGETNAISAFIKNVQARKPGTFLISTDHSN